MTDGVSIGVAIAAGLISFLSPCVLPLVPAYLGQLTAVAVAADDAADGQRAGPSRWTAFRHALAYVAGFGLIFTFLGVTATFAAAGLSEYMPVLRQIGGVILIVLRIPRLERTWRPLDAGAAAAVASSTGTMSLAPAGGPGFGERLGGRLVSSRSGWLASFGLGAIFAVGWTPCIGVILGGILTMATRSETVAQSGLLLLAYTAGLGLPFLAIALVYDRAPAILRPLVRHGRAVSAIGGALVVAIGVAMLLDWLALLPRWFNFAGV
jgi:cytochrome c-type biogenesis protein